MSKRIYDPISDLVTDEDAADVRSGDHRRACAAIDRVIARVQERTAELRRSRHELIASTRTFYPPDHPRYAAWRAELDTLAA